MAWATCGRREFQCEFARRNQENVKNLFIGIERVLLNMADLMSPARWTHSDLEWQQNQTNLIKFYYQNIQQVEMMFRQLDGMIAIADVPEKIFDAIKAAENAFQRTFRGTFTSCIPRPDELNTPFSNVCVPRDPDARTLAVRAARNAIRNVSARFGDDT